MTRAFRVRRADGTARVDRSNLAVGSEQTCVLHLVRNTFRLASRADEDKMAQDLRTACTAVNEADAEGRLDVFHDRRGEKYPAIPRLREYACGSVGVVYGIRLPLR